MHAGKTEVEGSPQQIAPRPPAKPKNTIKSLFSKARAGSNSASVPKQGQGSTAADSSRSDEKLPKTASHQDAVEQGGRAGSIQHDSRASAGSESVPAVDAPCQQSPRAPLDLPPAKQPAAQLNGKVSPAEGSRARESPVPAEGQQQAPSAATNIAMNHAAGDKTPPTAPPKVSRTTGSSSPQQHAERQSAAACPHSSPSLPSHHSAEQQRVPNLQRRQQQPQQHRLCHPPLSTQAAEPPPAGQAQQPLHRASSHGVAEQGGTGAGQLAAGDSCAADRGPEAAAPTGEPSCMGAVELIGRHGLPCVGVVMRLPVSMCLKP